MLVNCKNKDCNINIIANLYQNNIKNKEKNKNI